MKRCMTVALVVVASLLGASDASAVTKNFFDYCTTGAVKTCASVQVETQVIAGGTQVFLRVRNLQGTNMFDNTGGSLLTKIGLTAPDIQGASNLVVSTQGMAVGAGNPASLWNIQNSPGPGNIAGSVEFSAGTANSKEGAILGCDPSANVTSYFQTCDSTGDTGWVVFSFTTTNVWNASQAQIAFKVQAITGSNQDLSLECRSEDGSCATTTNIVPEPMSMVLMGSGLAGLIAVRRRRRRRESGLVDGDDSEDDR